MDELDERREELTALEYIFPELVFDAENPFSASLSLPVVPEKPLHVRFIPSKSEAASTGTTYSQAATNGGAYIERDVELSHLPSLTIQMTLPEAYPADAPPSIHIATEYSWLPRAKLAELEKVVANIWEDNGRSVILYHYIDHLQQEAERGFDLDQSAEGCLVLPGEAEERLAKFDTEAKQAAFNAATFDCGICIEAKKGHDCYRLDRCGDVFCRQCLQDFYNNAITEGDVTSVKCLAPDCGKDEATPGKKRKRNAGRTLHPRELLAMGIEESMVRRYVKMKRKKQVESDKTTVYCPRTWCQGPAKSSKYPPIPDDLTKYEEAETSSDNESDGEVLTEDVTPKKKPTDTPAEPEDRLRVCEECKLAFCKVCYMGWHGQFVRCYPRDPNELSVEEKASYDYIRMNTSPCPTCYSPVQKTHGCNHMRCAQCNTHFCYLCGFWLDGENPYQHFNKPGAPCYQRLFELGEGDEGQGPGDGQGFGGARGWEQMAIDAAREAEAEEAVAAAQVEADERVARDVAGVQEPPAAPAAALAHMQIHDDDNEDDALGIEALLAQQRAERRRRRPVAPPAPRAQGNAAAVRNHERNRGGRNRAAAPNGRAVRPPALNEERQQHELQRFMEMAQRDQEEEWDSDELGDDEEGFAIR